ncbi:MAG: dTMP kinase [Gammaproteobacteria bacterium]
MSGPRGLLVTVEGIEGVGKSTQLGPIAEHLRKAGRTVLETREPGGTALGERIRDLVLAPALAPMASMTELLLMFAARAEHIDKVLAPALAAGTWVVCDRYSDASYAYQGGGRQLPMDAIVALEDLVAPGLRPDLTLLLDAPVEVAMARARRRHSSDRFEGEGRAFFERVRGVYLKRAVEFPRRFRLVDAGAPLETVTAAICRHLDPLLA